MTRSPAIPLRIRLIGAGAALILAPGLARAQCEVGVVSDPATLWYGTSADIDGDLAVIGYPLKERVLVYRKEGGQWILETFLTVPEADDDSFATAVAISGDRVIAGDYQFPNGTGAAYVFRRTEPGSWILEGTLTADDGHPGQWFGWAVDLDGEVAIVGARADSQLGKAAGAAYVFRLTGGSWKQEAKLLALDGADGHLFGDAVAVHGSTAVCGAMHHPDGGKAYVFDTDGSDWTHTASLEPYDFPGKTSKFGRAVAIHSGIVAVSSSDGKVWTYKPEGRTWVPDGIVTTTDPLGCFGRAVALTADRLLIGAPCTFLYGEWAGAAALFDRAGGSWSQRGVLIGSQVESDDWFGSYVGLSGDDAVVGELQGQAFWSQTYFFDLGASCLPCYADLNNSGDLDLFDFLAFVNAFNAGQSAADCDGNGQFEIFDFFCFVNYFNEGC